MCGESSQARFGWEGGNSNISLRPYQVPALDVRQCNQMQWFVCESQKAPRSATITVLSLRRQTVYPHLNQSLGDVVGFNLSAWSGRSGRYGHELKDASLAFQLAEPIGEKKSGTNFVLGVFALQLYRKAVH